MKLYNTICRLCYLILLYLQYTWALPLIKPPQVKNTELGGNRQLVDRLRGSSSSLRQVYFLNSESLYRHVKRSSYRQDKTVYSIQEVNRGVTHSKQVNNTKSVLRTTAKTQSTGVLNSSKTTTKFQESLHNLQLLQHKEVDLASAQGLHQQLNEVDSKFKTSKMVVTVASTLAALFSMSLLVAIFQCCCRKKQKRNSSSSNDSKTNKDNKVVNGTENTEEDVNRKSNSHMENNQPVDSSENNHMDTTEKKNESEEKKDNIKSKIKAFEVKKDTQIHPSPEPVKHGRKRPESDAFKAFESKGIIMGMGKAPKLQVTKEAEEDEKQTEVTPMLEETTEETQEEVDKMGKVADNPDVVIASDDEDDAFAELGRETEVLKSYRKAAPPQGRNRSSRAFRLQQAEQSKTNLFDLSMGMGPLSPTLEESNRNSNVDNRLVVPEITETNPDKTDKTTDESTNNRTKEPSPPLTDKVDENVVPAGGNIFLQIDPTVRKKPAVTPPVLRKKPDTDSQGSRDSAGRRDKAKSSPLFLSNEKLMKDLEDKLKRQSSDKKKESGDGNKDKAVSKETLQTAL